MLTLFSVPFPLNVLSKTSYKNICALYTWTLKILYALCQQPLMFTPFLWNGIGERFLPLHPNLHHSGAHKSTCIWSSVKLTVIFSLPFPYPSIPVYLTGQWVRVVGHTLCLLEVCLWPFTSFVGLGLNSLCWDCSSFVYLADVYRVNPSLPELGVELRMGSDKTHSLLPYWVHSLENKNIH